MTEKDWLAGSGEQCTGMRFEQREGERRMKSDFAEVEGETTGEGMAKGWRRGVRDDTT